MTDRKRAERRATGPEQPDDSSEPAEGSSPAPDDGPTSGYAFVTGGAYGVLAVLGVLLGLLGSVHFSWTLGGVPLGASVAVLLNLAVFLLAGIGMRSTMAVMVPAVPWVAVAFPLSLRRMEGDLIVTATMPGYVYLFGSVAAALLAFTIASNLAARHIGKT